jgi:hypothetical protein
MAIPAQGFEITIENAEIKGIQQIEIGEPSGEVIQFRGGSFRQDLGALRLISFEPIEFPLFQNRPLLRTWTRATRMRIACRGVIEGGITQTGLPGGSKGERQIILLQHWVRYKGPVIRAAANDVIRFDHSFTIIRSY